ncbi:MAG TPA: hypothetical protein VD886_16130 [Herpetosiphonaceae bacterium]|nr:hypothetical protein [Herpetosiphonaceae bacterium]
MLRSRRPLAFFLAAQVGLLALVGAIWNGSTSAQDSKPTDLRGVITTSARLVPSRPNGTSDTIGTLPAPKSGYGYISIPSSAFQPSEGGYQYSNFGKGIINANNPSAPQYWSVGLDLPQGAIVTQLVMVAGDVKPDVANSLDGTLNLGVIASKLDELNLQSNPPSERDIAIAQSYPNTPKLGDLGIYITNIDLNDPQTRSNATIDNSLFAYHAQLAIPANADPNTPQTVFRSARIEYAMPTVLNLPRIHR